MKTPNTINLHKLAELVISDETAGIQMMPVERLRDSLKAALRGMSFLATEESVIRVHPCTRSDSDGAMAKQVGGDHYKGDKIQHIEFVHANNIPYPEACAMKYLTRHKKKNGVQDIDKAIHYCLLLRKLDYPDAPPLQNLT
jgi:hypothetical protein